MINIIVDNVFDPEGNPDENKALYRFANRVHVRTRPEVIQNALLFKAGDRYDGRVLDESARALRARGFLADVRIVYRTYDAASNSVDVEVRVRDAWSLSLNAKLSHSGGKTEWGHRPRRRQLLRVRQGGQRLLQKHDRPRRVPARLP